MLWAVSLCVWYLPEDGPGWEHNASKPLVHEHCNLEGLCGYFNVRFPEMGSVFRDQLSGNYAVKVRWSRGVLSLGLGYIELTLLWHWEEPSSSSSPQSDISSEQHLQIILRILFIIASHLLTTVRWIHILNHSKRAIPPQSPTISVWVIC